MIQMQRTANEWGIEAQSALSSSAVYALRGLKIDLEAGELRIRGAVSSFYYKQLAQETVLAAAPGVRVVNQVEVA